jgi:hypothetical protein
VVEHLPSKPETLSSNPRYHKKMKTKKKNEGAEYR